MRLDQFLVENGHFDSRAKAQAAIKAGGVTVNGAAAHKASMTVPEGAVVEGVSAHPYVSRGGVKLAAALAQFNVRAEGAVCLDLGASTGGFTEVLLQNGAARVYAVDVGRGQLHQSLAADRRVVSLEGTHAKDVTARLIPDAIDVIVADVSFISLKKALPPVFSLAEANARLVALVKPQFEVGRDRIGKGGLVKGETNDIVDDIAAWLAGEGWPVDGVIESPIRGGDGNREHLIAATKTP